MDHIILDSGLKIEYMVKENTHGMMVDNLMEIGLIIIWMVLEYTPGKMVVDMKDNIKKTKNMAKEFTLGLMVENMMDNGLMGDNMEKASIYQNRDNLEKVFGKMEKENIGLMESMVLYIESILTNYRYIFIYILHLNIIN
jgi:hypothetical protein